MNRSYQVSLADVPDRSRRVIALQEEILHLRRKLQRCKDQFAVLKSQVVQVQVRYDRASSDNNRTFRRLLQLRLNILNGLIRLYYNKAVEIAVTLDASTVLLHNLTELPEHPDMFWDSPEAETESDSDETGSEDDQQL